MESKKTSALSVLLFITFNVVFSQVEISPGVYFSDSENVRHELKIDDRYLIISIYATSPAKFIKTFGGFYKVENNGIKLSLEFNSDYKAVDLPELILPFTTKDNLLVVELETPTSFLPTNTADQALDGQWLFATRGPDEGQERRGDENPRKTLKFLMDGRFQWIAYNTETMEFFGTGGGAYSSTNGVYTEEIEYFSRDDSRVGAKLSFNYDLKEGDWHHTGKNSKGEPMYEIWARR
ncbi:MAG: hypothetical protein WBM83_09570 [Flavobacteriaceae bacterium]